MPAASLGNYQEEVVSYTRGQGRLFCSLRGYEPCHNAAEIIEARGYHAEQDLENPSGSVFCSHGAGLVVPWNQVREHMHIDSGWKPDAETAESKEVQERSERADGEVRRKNASWKEENRQFAAREKELQEIFERTFRTSSKDETVRPGWKRSGEKRTVEAAVGGQVRQKTAAAKNSEKEYLLVDG